ncbi:MAG: hypothetical protein J6328_06835 [Bacilli bacterium]|nr:hypothetical protein [Bacilli bacterium]
MKKVRSALTSSILLLGLLFAASACGQSAKLPTSDREKVQFAFNGVEKSLKGGKRRSLHKPMALDGPKSLERGISGESLATIYEALSLEEETDNPSFEYDEPPMIQFQYLKALYEEMGEDFAFGTKYSYETTGSVYYDFATRTAPNEAEYLNEYSFTCSVVLDIDEDDLIAASVGFDLVFTHDGVSRNEKMYVELLLDYDMEKATPNYELSMNAVTDLLDYPNEDERYFNDEYDYVKVQDNSIREWRKFGICSPMSLTEYESQDFVYKYSTLRTYKDAKKYKNENPYNKSVPLKNAVVDCLHLDDTLEGYRAFYLSSGEENPKIKTVIDKFSKISGRDIVNNLVYTGGSEKWVDDRPHDDNLFLRIIAKNDTLVVSEPSIYEDYSLLDLFNPNGNVVFDQKGGMRDYLSIYLKNGEDNDVAVYNNFDSLNVKVRSTSYDRTDWIDVRGSENNPFTRFVESSGYRLASYSDQSAPLTLEFDITLKEKPEVTLQSPFRLTLRNEEAAKTIINKWGLVNKYINAYAPSKDAIPEFVGPESIVFTAAISENNGGGDKESDVLFSGRIGYQAEGGLAQAVDNYKDKLTQLGYTKSSFYSIYTKRINDLSALKLSIYHEGMDFEFIAKPKQEETVNAVIERLIGDETVEVAELPDDCEYSVEGNNIRIQDPQVDLNAYVQSLEEYGFLIGVNNGATAAYKYVNGVLYRFRDLGYSLAVEKVNLSLTLVGDFNYWSQDDTSEDFVEFTIGDFGDVYFQRTIDLAAEQAFKVVKNHSWDNGGYGYNLFSGSNTNDPKYYRMGESDSILVVEAGTYRVGLAIALDMFSADVSNNHFNPLMMDVVKLSKSPQ